MSKITLNSISDLTQSTTAQTTINANSSTIQTAFDNTLSRDGTSPNQMGAALDMNSNQIFNLPVPSTQNSPARLIDVVSNPTITIPGTGTSGHVVPFLDGNNTWSGTQTIGTAAVTTLTTTTLNGSSVPTAGTSGHTIPFLDGNNTFSGTSTFTNTVTLPSNTTIPNTINKVITQVFSSPGTSTYTPSTGMLYCIVECVGGGGGGGGAAATTSPNVSGGSGGAAGGYCRKTFPAATIGASKSVTVGAGGTATAGAAGGAGGASSLGALLTANGGGAGFFFASASNISSGGGANGGTATGGDINIQGTGGGDVLSVVTTGSGTCVIGGLGGTSIPFGSATPSPISTAGGSLVGLNAQVGGGGSGAVSNGTAATPQPGGTGGPGIVIITEFTT